MTPERITKPPFAVIGKLGSTEDGPGFVQRLWADANAHFEEISGLALRGENGLPLGIWGAMSDFSGTFLPWEENFSRGLYLAGVETSTDAAPPAGWTKWILPGWEYLKFERTGPDSFPEALKYLEKNDIPLAGAVQDFTDPAEGKEYMLFPVRRL